MREVGRKGEGREGKGRGKRKRQKRRREMEGNAVIEWVGGGGGTEGRERREIWREEEGEGEEMGGVTRGKERGGGEGRQNEAVGGATY